MGKPVAWVEGFPFNLGLRHPQYVGNQLTWWAFYAVSLAFSGLLCLGEAAVLRLPAHVR